MTAKVIKQAQQIIESQSIELVTFDLFDTLIYRRVAKPIAIFAQAYESAKQDVSLEISAREYMELRQFAEKKCKESTPTREVSLEQIISMLPASEPERTRLLQAELETEKLYSFLDTEIKAFILALIESGKRVAFISDMYLSTQQIRECFFDGEPDLCRVPLYVSGENGVNKASGAMFKLVRKAENADVNRWLHIGDHEISDVKNPALYGIETVHSAPTLPFKRIVEAEQRLFDGDIECNASRYIAALSPPADSNVPAFELGAFIWGPVLLAFADWVVDKVLASKASSVLCLMREGEVFVPLIETRLQQRNISGVNVVKFYASRKSTFWPSIDIDSDDWLDSTIKTLLGRRGYTVADFYSDFDITPDQLTEHFSSLEFRDSDGVFYESETVFKLICQRAFNAGDRVRQRIAEQKQRFVAYYENTVAAPLGQCVTVDLGNGGTIQNHIELALGATAAANLLMYSTNRIYGKLETLYHSFIGAHNDRDNLRRLLARSPECIESFLLGDTGTTLGYTTQGEPVLGKVTQENSLLVNSFFQGVQQFFATFAQYKMTVSSLQPVTSILTRFIKMPTLEEARIYQHLYHEDNFGADKSYPVISEEQLAVVRELGVEAANATFYAFEHWQIGKLHWPQAIITVLSPDFHFKHAGLLLNNNHLNIENLIALIESQGWQRFTVYGGGVFFEQFYEASRIQNFEVERVVDRKAELNGDYEINQIAVCGLKAALQAGSRRFVITSFAFKDAIAKNIYAMATDLGIVAEIEVISL